MSKFGWSYPPGCDGTPDDNLDAYIGQNTEGVEEDACEVCGVGKDPHGVCVVCERRDEMKCYCGLPMSKNPHPDAGDPERLLVAGAAYVCVPCTVRSLHSTRRFYEERMNELQKYQHELPEPHRTAICNILANGKPRP